MKVALFDKIVSDLLDAKDALLSNLFDICSFFVAIPIFYAPPRAVAL